MNKAKNINSGGLFSIMRHEFRMIFSDSGVLLITIFAMLIYTTIYSLAYGNEVVERVAIAVIDNDNSPSSRSVIEGLQSGPNTEVRYLLRSIEEAKRLFFMREIFGIVIIPNGFERDLLNGNIANIATILDGSHLLLYKGVLEQATKDALTNGATIEASHLMVRGMNGVEIEDIVQPVAYDGHTLHNPSGGYGSFVMPSIVVVIMQQTIIIGLAMLAARRRNMIMKAINPIVSTMAKVLTYIVIYGINLTIILAIIWPLFGFPFEGNIVDIAIVMTLYIVAIAALGLSLSHLFNRRETPLMLLLWSSVPILLLAGVSYPKEAFPEWLYVVGKVFPSSSAVNAFVNIGSAGATLGDVWPDVATLIALALIYLSIAIYTEKKSMSKNIPKIVDKNFAE